MSTNLIAQTTDFVEQAKQLPDGCDFFKELAAICEPYAETAFEAFREDWLTKYEAGEIELEVLESDDGTTFETDELGWNMTHPSSIAEYKERCQSIAYSEGFLRCAMLPITDTHREFIVICHARRLDTEKALVEMVNYFSEFAYLRQEIVVSEKEVDGIWVAVGQPNDYLDPLFKVWKRAFSYLRPTHSRWPHQKYGELWREAKVAYAQAQMLEYSGTRESVIAGLAEAVQKAQDIVRSSSGTYFDKRVKTLIALSTALHKILRDEQAS